MRKIRSKRIRMRIEIEIRGKENSKNEKNSITLKI